MPVKINDELGQGYEMVELPADGTITGTLDVTWLPEGRATVSGTVAYRNRSWAISYARFNLSGEEWVFQSENMMVPVRVNVPMGSGTPAAPTFQAAILAAVSGALKATYTPDTGRAVGLARTLRRIGEVEQEEARLLAELEEVRVTLRTLRKQRDRYGD